MTNACAAFNNNLELIKSVVNESDIEDFLQTNPDYIESGLKIIDRQFHTDYGIIDLLGKDLEGNLVIVEVKIDATYDAVSQIGKYMLALTKEHPNQKIRGILAAKSIPAQVAELCQVCKIEPLVLNNLGPAAVSIFQKINQRLERIEKAVLLQTECYGSPVTVKSKKAYGAYSFAPVMRKILTALLASEQPLTYAELANKSGIQEGSIRSQLSALKKQYPAFPIKKEILENRFRVVKLLDKELVAKIINLS